MADENINIFTYYTITPNPPKGKWDYKTRDFPDGWDWVGGSYCSNYTEYDREDQFGGPANKETEMIYCLEQYYEKLRQVGVIKIYKVCRET